MGPAGNENNGLTGKWVKAAQDLKSKVEEVNVQDRTREEVDGKSSLRWYNTAKEEFSVDIIFDR